MRHRVHTRKLGRTSAHRVSMYRNLVTSLLEHEKIETTHAKAQELRRLADRMITLGKRGDLHARRQALRVVRGRSANAKLFGELAQRYAGRPGGYTRVLRTRRRVGDAAEMSIVELVEPAAAPASEAPARKKRASRRKAASAEKSGTRKAGARKTGAKKAGTGKTGQRKAATSAKASRRKSGAKADAD